MARSVVAAVDPNDRACTGASRPPAWMLSECTSEAEAAHVRDAYRLVRTTANGDCLFHSVRLGLLSVPDSGAPTSARLREAVARTVLDRRDRAASAALLCGATFSPRQTIPTCSATMHTRALSWANVRRSPTLHGDASTRPCATHASTGATTMP
ncbi:OTU superfamily incomplete domain containing protein [Pandoravirus celtis]|uniref:OTU superfamily incomplete domain containing protein n=1 Tax=Pandoravirus celtis TaxID=2568002 RepID=A0A4D6EH13_9VIRU|nr:OTU superfamily incomplete domain containing protein [Pandoravirus celtis]